MALINKNNIFKIEKNRNSVHKEVDCSYIMFLGNNGQRYIQLDTYGSKDRQFAGKVSQTIQFNKETAQYLVDVLKQEFGI